ncbi:MAG TPA: PocR ligand-binding domain-containing protein [Lacunisphaera sp.]|nr:PocR ligand-binding domain-containing protein [Lacunisphaera sp.]
MMNSAGSHATPSRKLVEHLKKSDIFRDYQRAFNETTGLPLALRALDTLDLPLHGAKNENPFCALMAASNKSCAACLEFQKRVEVEAQLEPKTLRCFAGLCDSAVPVRVGENVVAFLQTGQVLMHAPNKEQFTKLTAQLLKFGAEVDVTQLEEAYFQTRVLEKRQYEAVVRLLTIFAQHLSTLSNQLVVAGGKVDSPMVAKAKLYISEHQGEEISLRQVSSAVNTSAFYFCKIFKQATGLTFTDYLARVRIEKVKNLLQNPHKRISEAAFEAGFQSLSQFNRVFRKIEGESPTTWRDKRMSKLGVA